MVARGRGQGYWGTGVGVGWCGGCLTFLQCGFSNVYGLHSEKEQCMVVAYEVGGRGVRVGAVGVMGVGVTLPAGN